ncbi:MAG: cytochrome c biogenesis protein CcdA [Oscillospiraceae bacterium]|jgi:cytochrome c-type biogenesis protein|nr:cytochrome c biogenesis protein CcdA [Oscillospiraceae bacterium]
MAFLITFLEGFISFISPCMLPLLPLYISYFAGGADRKHRVLARAGCFVLGFSIVFSLLGLFAGTLGAFLREYQTAVNIISGCIVILFGLSYLEVLSLPFFKGIQSRKTANTALSALIFGVIYALCLTPCIGAFLGSALMMASVSGTAAKGALLLLAYCLGLGIPFLLSAILIEKLHAAFAFIKRHYKTINLVCGVFLIVIGLLMIFGLMNRAMALLL